MENDNPNNVTKKTSIATFFRSLRSSRSSGEGWPPVGSVGHLACRRYRQLLAWERGYVLGLRMRVREERRMSMLVVVVESRGCIAGLDLGTH